MQPDVQSIFGNLKVKAIDVEPGMRYGFAYTNSRIGIWLTYFGSFPYLFGVFQGTVVMEELQVEEGMEESEYEAYTFFDLTDDLQPTNLICSATVPIDLTNHIGVPTKITVRDLVVILGNPPKFSGKF